MNGGPTAWEACVLGGGVLVDQGPGRHACVSKQQASSGVLTGAVERTVCGTVVGRVWAGPEMSQSEAGAKGQGVLKASASQGGAPTARGFVGTPLAYMCAVLLMRVPLA